MRPNLRNSILYVGICVVCVQIANGQVLNKPEPTDNPNLSGNSAWTEACASADFNQYFVNFTWNTPLVNGDNEFILELSDAQGSFSNPLELDRASDKNTTFDFDFEFSVPSDVQGDGYKFRVRSTSPAMTSEESDTFSIYFIGFNNRILISPDGSGDIPSDGTIQLCDGSSATLATHNVPDPQNYSYNWYRSGTLLSERSNAITVNQPGLYFVEIDYGIKCSGSANTLSFNIIEIITGTNQGIAVTPPSTTALCSGETLTLNANITGQGYNYAWYKDGTLLTGPVLEGSSFVVDANTVGFEGDYEVEISGDGICTERSPGLTITNADNYTVTRDNEETIVLLPTQTRTLSVSTNANNPQYQWYKDGNPISGATSSSLDVDQAGSYFVRVSQTGGACTSSSKDSEATNVVEPQNFEITLDYTSQYVSCGVSNTNLGIREIIAIANGGNRTDVTQDMLSSFSYQWLRDGIDINGETSSAIVIGSSSDNGDYQLRASAGAFTLSSNVLPVQLRTDQNITISTDNAVLCDGANTANLTTTFDLSSGVSYQWLRGGQPVSSGATLNTSQSGSYQLEVTLQGCPVLSNEVQLTDFDDTQLVLDNDTDLIIPEGTSTTVNASGATTYEWYDSDNNLLGTGASFSFSEEGQFTLLATIGNCQVTRAITVDYRDTFLVPNVITANGDGINDLWILPNTFSNDEDIRIIIFNEKGEEVLNQTNYQNNWPQSSVAFNRRNQIFYYKIRNTSETLKQGTITVIR